MHKQARTVFAPYHYEPNKYTSLLTQTLNLQPINISLKDGDSVLASFNSCA